MNGNTILRGAVALLAILGLGIVGVPPRMIPRRDRSFGTQIWSSRTMARPMLS